MTAKQPTRRLGLPLTCVLTLCVLLAVAGMALHLSPPPAGSRRSAQQQARGTTLRRANASSSDVLPLESAASRQRLLGAYGRVPLDFEANQGQTDPQVKYLARGNGYTLFLTSSEAVLAVSAPQASAIKQAMRRRTAGFASSRQQKQRMLPRGHVSLAVLHMGMVGANPNPQIASNGALPGKSNYLIGKDSRQWHIGVPHYARVDYKDVYAGVDLTFHGAQRQLEFDFVVAPGADPAPIGLRFTGADCMTTDAAGNLVLSTSAGDLTLHKPVAYQEKDGARQLVDARFAVKDGKQIGFTLANYDHSRALVIDPALSYSTYLGGGNQDDGFGIAVDSTGSVYVTGETSSSSFPGASGSPAGGFDAFVTKLNPAGSSISYTTLLGGSSDEVGSAIAVDSATNAYVTGFTNSSDFPVTAGAAQGSGSFNGGNCLLLDGSLIPCSAGFVAKLNVNGAVSYATYVTGNYVDFPFAIAIDGSGNAYIGGETLSPNFVTTVGAFQTFTDGDDGFVTKINTNGTAFPYSTYLGGGNSGLFNVIAGDLINGIAVVPGCNSNCNVFVTGDTISIDFPLKNAIDPTCGTDGFCNFALDDGFVTELNSSGSQLTYSTYLGGEDIDIGTAIALDSSGAAYVTGGTASLAFPLDAPFQSTLFAFSPFVTKLNPFGSGLVYSSYLGGSAPAIALSIAADANGSAYVTGTTIAIDFPLVDAFQTIPRGNSDAFVSMIDPLGSTVVYSSLIGGNGDEDYDSNSSTFLGGVFGGFLTVDRATGTAYVTGDTTSTNNFPTAAPLQASFGGGAADAFVTKVTPAPSTPEPSVGVFPSGIGVFSGQTTSIITVTVTPLNGFSGTVDLACSGLPAHAGCNFSSTSVVAPGTSDLTISTNVASASLTPANRRSGLWYAMLLPVGGLALLGAGFASSGSRQRKLMAFLLGALVFSGLILLGACGSSYGGGGGGPNTTPPGNYSITVTGTSSASPHNATLLLSVQ